MPFKIDRASHIVGRTFTVFALFCFVFGSNFQVHAPRAYMAYIRRCDLKAGFLRYEFGGLIFGGVFYKEGLIFGILRLTSRNTKR